MRVGVVIGQPQSLDAVRAVTLPFNINACGDGGNAGGARGSRVSAAIRGTGRANRASGCMPRAARLGLEYWESAANFVLVRVGDAVPLVVQALAARGVHVRDRSKDPTTPGCIRITAGMLDHTDAAIEALESVCRGRDAR